MTGVETSAGRIATPKVVLVAGAWAASLLTPLGLDYGLTPHRIQVSIFRWPAGFTQRHPAVIDAIHKAWMRPEGAASTLIGVELGSRHADPEKFDESVDERLRGADAAAALGARWPRLRRRLDARRLGRHDHDEPRRPARSSTGSGPTGCGGCWATPAPRSRPRRPSAAAWPSGS